MKSIHPNPYLLSAFFDFIVDNGGRPFIAVAEKGVTNTKLRSYIRDGQLVLNISPQASMIEFQDDHLFMSARFAGELIEELFSYADIGIIYDSHTGAGFPLPVIDPDPNKGLYYSASNQPVAIEPHPTKKPAWTPRIIKGDKE